MPVDVDKSYIEIISGENITVVEVGIPGFQSLSDVAFAIALDAADPRFPLAVPIGSVPGGELEGTWLDPSVRSVHGPEGDSHADLSASLIAGDAQTLASAAADTDADIATHEAAADPHTAYLTSAEGDAKITAHEAAVDPHPTYETAGEVDSKLVAHESAVDPHPTYMTAGEVDTRVAVHEAAADPHTAYLTSAEGDAKIATHEGLADPHTGYQKESDKGVASGYAGLDSGGKVPDAQLPDGLTRDAELATSIADEDASIRSWASVQFLRKVLVGRKHVFVDPAQNNGDAGDVGDSWGNAMQSLDIAMTSLDGGSLGNFADYGVNGPKSGLGHVYVRGLHLTTDDVLKYGTIEPSGPNAGGAYTSRLWVGLGTYLHGIGPFVGYTEIRDVGGDGASELNPKYAVQTGFTGPPTPSNPQGGTDTVWLGQIEQILISAGRPTSDGLQFLGGLFKRNPTNMALVNDINIGVGGGSTGTGKFPLHGFREGGDNFGTRTPVSPPPVRLDNTAYAVGDVVRPPQSGQAYYFAWFVCIQAGVSAGASPSFTYWPSVVTDGTVKWLGIFNGSGPNFAITKNIFVHGSKMAYLIEGGSTSNTYDNCGCDPDVLYSEDVWVVQDTREGKNPSQVRPSGNMEILLTGCKQEHHGLNTITGKLSRAWRFEKWINNGLQPTIVMVAPCAESPGVGGGSSPVSALTWKDDREPPSLRIVGGHVSDDFALAMEFPALPHYNREMVSGYATGSGTPLDFDPSSSVDLASGIMPNYAKNRHGLLHGVMP